MSNSLKQVATKGILWSSIERFSVQGIQFVIMIIMARLLTPEDYGLVGMLTIFLAVSQSLIDSGFSQALIRKQNRTEVDNSTVFYFNIAVGLALYLLFYISAPWVADFYGLPELSLVMRVVCLGIIFNSLAVVQRALLTVRIDFKTQAKASLIAAVISGMAGIILAYTGFGVVGIGMPATGQSGDKHLVIMDLFKMEAHENLFLEIFQGIVLLWLQTVGVRSAGYHLQQYLSHCHRQGLFRR